MENPKTDPNAAAHPVKYIELTEHNCLTKREYFSIHCDIPWYQAASNFQNAYPEKEGKATNQEICVYRAKMAVLYADTLIAELNKPKTDEPAA